MTFNDFINKYNGKGIDYDKYYGYQCMDLYQQYNKEVVGAPSIPSAAAADVWTNYPKDYYEKIANGPSNAPQFGDVIIWKKAANLPYGHIAVCKTADANTFTSFDQNWPTGSVCHLQQHNYTNVQGWLRPKTQVTSTTTVVFTFSDQTLIPVGGEFGEPELQAVRGVYGDAKRMRDEITGLKRDVSDRDARNKELQENIDSLSTQLIQALKKVKELTPATPKTPAKPAPKPKDEPVDTVELPPFLTAFIDFLKRKLQ